MEPARMAVMLGFQASCLGSGPVADPQPDDEAVLVNHAVGELGLSANLVACN